MKNYLLLFIISIIPSLGFSQDPSCEYILTLKNVNDSLYRYKFILEDNYKDLPLDSIKNYLKKGWINWGNINSAILESEGSNKKILVGHFSEYCYPNAKENQLRIIIARQNKQDENIELMYSYSKIAPFLTEIVINDFYKGERRNEIFKYKERYLSEEPKEYDYIEYRIYNKRIMLIF